MADQKNLEQQVHDLAADIIRRIKEADDVCLDDAQYRAMVKTIITMGEYEMSKLLNDAIEKLARDYEG